MTIIGGALSKLSQKLKAQKKVTESTESNEDEGEGNYKYLEDNEDYGIPEEEIEMINDFLYKFVFTSDSFNREQIDLRLMLKALPNKITEFNVDNTELINFNLI
jgi:hypothetical protein